MGRYGAYDPHTIEYQIYRGEATDSCVSNQQYVSRLTNRVAHHLYWYRY